MGTLNGNIFVSKRGKYFAFRILSTPTCGRENGENFGSKNGEDFGTFLGVNVYGHRSPDRDPRRRLTARQPGSASGPSS